MTTVCDLPAVEQAAHLRTGALSALDVVEAHLLRIEQLNPMVNAVVTVAADQARASARAADARLAGGGPVGPLHGLPVAVKDVHDTAGIRTTYGSPLFAHHVPARDELLVERLRAAGAIIIGKTNVPEFAAGSHTFNRVFGVTRNPYDLDRSAGGSSGGAAAALACGMTALADGSDMGGSLRNPASFCNVVGLRPSPGRVPTWPTVAPWATLAVQGPMGRSVADTALLLSALAGPDPRSPIALSEPGAVFGAGLERDLAGLRVAWSADLAGSVVVAPDVVNTLVPQLQVFSDLGCVVVEDCPDLSGADDVFRTLRAWQFELAFGELVDRHPKAFKESLRDEVARGRTLRGTDVARAELLHGQIFHRMREFFEQYDVLVSPVSQVLPFPVELEYPSEIDGVPMSTYLDWMGVAYLVSTTGCPALSVPAGFTPEGMPVGLQVIGPHRADLFVLQVGAAFERSAGASGRRPALVTRRADAADFSTD